MSDEKRLDAILKEVGEACLTIGRIDPADVRCQTCSFVAQCVEARKLLPKEETTTSQGRTRNWIGLYDNSVEMFAIYQRILDQIHCVDRPMKHSKRAESKGLVPYTHCPWNDSNTTIYEYQNRLVDRGLAVGRNRIPFMIRFDQFPMDLCIYLKNKVERMQENGVLA
jgi:hypothetical protein